LAKEQIWHFTLGVEGAKSIRQAFKIFSTKTEKFTHTESSVQLRSITFWEGDREEVEDVRV